MVSRRRRVIDDTDDDDTGDENDDENENGAEEDSEKTHEAAVARAEEKKSQQKATSMVDRLKRRAAKSAEAAQTKRLKTKNEITTEISLPPNRSPKNSTSTNSTNNAGKTTKKEKSIPKKPKKTLTIPKKQTLSDDKQNTTATNEENVNAKKETPSLLSEMKNRPPKTNYNNRISNGSSNSSSNNIKASHIENTKNKPRPFHSSWGTTQSTNNNNNNNSKNSSNTPGSGAAPKPMSSRSPARLSPPNHWPYTPPPTVNLTDSPVGPFVSTSGAKKEETREETKLQQLVFGILGDLCQDTFPIPPERDGVDLFASFLRHKDQKPATTMHVPSGGSGDGNANANNLQYDFFDVDATTGSIVVQPKIPIFPEDFPTGANQEWPLSWWGIVDPSIEEKKQEEKEEPKVDADEEKKSTSRRDRSASKPDGATSTEGKDCKRDRNKRDSSRNARKRSSRDRHEDEPQHFDGYVPWENRHDPFPGGPFYDGGRGRYPGGYPPGPRNYSLNGDAFPIRDRPPPDGRPYPRNEGPPRDFRGGGRPYPVHDGGWDYPAPLGDPYGPQGRGRFSRGDRDRSRRSPHSKADRDDHGRHSGQKPSGGSHSKERSSRSSK